MGGSELAPKVKAVYQAVIELLLEGADLSCLTVAEITGKAGIGKGTVYEYFDSKEDMIAGALYHEMENGCRYLSSKMRQMDHLYDKINLILNNMEQQAKEIISFARMVHVMMDHSAIGCRLHEMLEQRPEGDITLFDLIRQILEGEIEGYEKLPETERSYLVMTILSRMVCFALYQLSDKPCEELNSAMVREMICRDACQSIKFYKENGNEDLLHCGGGGVR